MKKINDIELGKHKRFSRAFKIGMKKLNKELQFQGFIRKGKLSFNPFKKIEGGMSFL